MVKIRGGGRIWWRNNKEKGVGIVVDENVIEHSPLKMSRERH